MVMPRKLTSRRYYLRKKHKLIRKDDVLMEMKKYMLASWNFFQSYFLLRSACFEQIQHQLEQNFSKEDIIMRRIKLLAFYSYQRRKEGIFKRTVSHDISQIKKVILSKQNVVVGKKEVIKLAGNLSEPLIQRLTQFVYDAKRMKKRNIRMLLKVVSCC
jgi:hypothetical protein